MKESFVLGSLALGCLVFGASSASRSQSQSSPCEFPPADTGRSARLLRCVAGIDSAPQAMSEDEAKKELKDPWGECVLRKGVFPADIKAAIAVIDQIAD